jgi:HlyD family secretion protein
VVFRVVDGKAELTPVVIDHRNSRWAEVIHGLVPDDEVILHPSDRVQNGTGVESY